MSELPQDLPGGKPRLQLDTMVHNGILIAKCEIEEIKKMEIKEDDIWVCSFPRSARNLNAYRLMLKGRENAFQEQTQTVHIQFVQIFIKSRYHQQIQGPEGLPPLIGTTLTQELVYLIETLDFDTAKSVQLDERFPIIDVKDDRFPYYRGVKFVEQMTSPRMVKAHMHYDFLPEQLQNGKGRIIYLSRNPKDIITSYYNLLIWLDEVIREETKSWDSFFQAFIDGTALHCPWPRHVLKYWERRDDKNLLFMKYEDLTKDLPNGVRQIAAFLGKTLSDDDVSRICEHCSVENMKKNDKVNLSYWRDVKHVNDNAGGGFINKGQAGAWKQKLTAEESAKVDGLISEVEKFGLVFDHVK